MKKKQIIVPVLIVLGIIGIWFYKNEGAIKNKDAIKSNVEAGVYEYALDATEDFDMEELKSYGMPLIIAFGSDGCPPCREMAPTLEEIHAKYQGKVLVKFVDVWENTAASKDFPLKVIPTQFFFNADGSPVKPQSNEEKFLLYSRKGSSEHVYTAHEGPMTKEEFEEMIKEMEAS